MNEFALKLVVKDVVEAFRRNIWSGGTTWTSEDIDSFEKRSRLGLAVLASLMDATTGKEVNDEP